MTTPPDPLLLDPTLELEPRPSYLAVVPLMEDTLARAGDVNQIQANVDAALRLFAGDVNTTVQTLVQALVYRLMAAERRQAAFETQITNAFAEYRTEVNASLADLRNLLNNRIDELTQFVNNKVAEMKEYADQRASETLTAARAYTDEREDYLLGLMWASAQGGTTFNTPIIGDDGNYFGGKMWSYNVATIPAGMEFHVYGYRFDWIPTADTGGAQDEVKAYWPNFFGQREYNDGLSHTEEVVGTTQPLFGIRGPYIVQAALFVNNIKGYGIFTMRGKLVPDALVALAPSQGWPMPTLYLGGGGGEGIDPSAPVPGTPSGGVSGPAAVYTVSFANLTPGSLHGQGGWEVANGSAVVSASGLSVNAPESATEYLGAVREMPITASGVRMLVASGTPALHYRQAGARYFAAWFTGPDTIQAGIREGGTTVQALASAVVVPGSGALWVELSYANAVLTLRAWRNGTARPSQASADMIVPDASTSPGGPLFSIAGGPGVVIKAEVI